MNENNILNDPKGAGVHLATDNQFTLEAILRACQLYVELCGSLEGAVLYTGRAGMDSLLSLPDIVRYHGQPSFLHGVHLFEIVNSPSLPISTSTNGLAGILAHRDSGVPMIFFRNP